MRGTGEVTDDLLVLSAQRGDAQAFEMLARRWHPRLLRHAYRLTGNPEGAADSVQEAWIGIVRGLRRLKDPARFAAWAHRIVGNKSRDWIRREQKRRGALETLEVERASGPSAVDPGGRDERVRDLRRAIAELDGDQQTILRLFYVEENGVSEIARITGLPAGTVKSRLFYARRRLREAMESLQRPSRPREEMDS